MNLSPNPFTLNDADLVAFFDSRIRPRYVAMLKDRARGLLIEPDRIPRMIAFPIGAPVPVSVSARLAYCRRRLAAERSLRAHHPHIFSLPRFDALRVAEIALRYQRRFGGREVVPMHEVEAA